MVAIVGIFVFRSHIKLFAERFKNSERAKAQIGPLKVEVDEFVNEGRQAVHNLNRLNLLMAESRLLELEVTQSLFANGFTTEQRKRMEKHIKEIRKLLETNNNL